MTVIDFKTRQIKEPNRIAELEQENCYLRSQLWAERQAKLQMSFDPPRKRHPLHIILALWFVGGLFFLDTALRFYTAVSGR